MKRNGFFRSYKGNNSRLCHFGVRKASIPVQMYERACYDAPKKEEQNLFEKISQIFG